MLPSSLNSSWWCICFNKYKFSLNSWYNTEFKWSKQWRMKISKVYSFQRFQLLKFQKKMRVSSSVTLGNVQRRVPFGCCPTSLVLRQVFCKLKNRWKQVLGWKRSSPQCQYSYDLHSYNLNFDDGPSNYHIRAHLCWLSFPFNFLLFWIMNKLFYIFFCYYVAIW